MFLRLKRAQCGSDVYDLRCHAVRRLLHVLFDRRFHNVKVVIVLTGNIKLRFVILLFLPAFLVEVIAVIEFFDKIIVHFEWLELLHLVLLIVLGGLLTFLEIFILAIFSFSKVG